MIVVQSELLVLLAPRFSTLRVRPDMVNGVQSEPLVLLGLGFSMLRIRLDAVSGILFAINRSDMWWVSIEIWSSDSKLFFVRIDHDKLLGPTAITGRIRIGDHGADVVPDDRRPVQAELI